MALFHCFSYIISSLSCEEAVAALLSAAHYSTSDGQLCILYTQGEGRMETRKEHDSFSSSNV